MHVTTLDDRFSPDVEHQFLTGNQALLRVAVMQRQLDQEAGLKTAAYITGYRGSPLGSLDAAAARAGKTLSCFNVHFEPGLNEELAATAVWGTQQANIGQPGEWQGVCGYWYGKGPGVDRSGDAFKHGNLAGSARYGGVQLWAGDDHLAKSSTTAHQSEFAFVDAQIPVFNPATLEDVLAFGTAGIALSRFSGVWTGMKLVTDLMDSTASISSPLPKPFIVPEHELPPGGLNIRWPDHWVDQEKRLSLYKLPAALEFARANRLDRVRLNEGPARIGIVTTGKSFLDVMEALKLLDVDEDRARQLGISVYKVAMPWPLEPEGLRTFASKLPTVLVVEEKRPLIEAQLREILYGLPAAQRPKVMGKRDLNDAPLLPSYGELTPRMIAVALVALGELPLLLPSQLANQPIVAIPRTPYFCSGCPHNVSTKIPEGSRAQLGIGCHFMAIGMNRETALFTQMGGEGANWIGQSRFSATKHIFQNLGDGTYFHSGSLAIRAAIAAKANITFKILYNDAVAMTGGQAIDGALDAARISRQVAAEGVQVIAVVTDDLPKYGDRHDFAEAVTFHSREGLDAVQRRLRDTPGVSVLIYDQVCAAEKRRRRKRGTMPAATRRAFINAAVCEGCGDCSRASNCVSVAPLETPFGRKRRIDQATCNQDLSCVDGFCPSFVTVEGGTKKETQTDYPAAAFAERVKVVSEPQQPSLAHEFNVIIAGIGGTGIVTVGAVLGMAAHLEGKGFLALDMTGLAQKGGPVTSHLRFASMPITASATRIGEGQADVLIGCDILTASSAELRPLLRQRVRVVLNTHPVMPGIFHFLPDLDLGAKRIVEEFEKLADVSSLDFSEIAARLFGDTVASNMLALGYAYQAGMIPVSAAAIARAIELNGASVDMNKAAFAIGRLARAEPLALYEDAATPIGTHETLEDLIATRAAFLTVYQDRQYATQYRKSVDLVREREMAAGQGDKLAHSYARGLFKLMAYKDEFEVARLHTDGQLRKDLQANFGSGYHMRFHMAPPLFAPKDANGRPRKIAIGGWLYPVLRVLAALRRVRGTRLDPFGRTEERRAERDLIQRYRTAVESASARLTAATHPLAIKLAESALAIRGFGHIKQAAASAVTPTWDELTREIERVAVTTEEHAASVT